MKKAANEEKTKMSILKIFESCLRKMIKMILIIVNKTIMIVTDIILEILEILQRIFSHVQANYDCTYILF